MPEISLEVNGKHVRADVAPNTLLADFLRQTLGLTGTHVGCDTSQCGGCVVHVNGNSVKSCTMLAVQANGARVTTIEGLSTGADLHPLQAAFRDAHGLQCGFCTPGFLMLITGVLERDPVISDEDLVEVLSSNLCRCTGYQNIVKAARSAAAELRRR